MDSTVAPSASATAKRPGGDERQPQPQRPRDHGRTPVPSVRARKTPAAGPSGALRPAHPVHAVPGAADRRDDVAAELAAQVPDVDLDDVEVLAVPVPDVVAQLDLADHLPGAAQQVLEQGELARGGRDRLPAERHDVARGVEATSPTVRTTGRGTAPRRSSARRRATSTTKAKGLVR